MTEATTNTERLINVVVYKDVSITVNEDGMFHALPPGARKWRTDSVLWKLKRQIDDYLDRQREKTRKRCTVPLRWYDEKKGQVVTGNYLGTRARATETHEEGHAFTTLGGEHVTKDKYRCVLRLVPHSVGIERINELETAKVNLVLAESKLREMIEKHTVEVQLPSFSYSPKVEELSKAQDTAIAMIRGTLEGDF